jgi:hypothetical protein
MNKTTVRLNMRNSSLEESEKVSVDLSALALYYDAIAQGTDPLGAAPNNGGDACSMFVSGRPA